MFIISVTIIFIGLLFLIWGISKNCNTHVFRNILNKYRNNKLLLYNIINLFFIYICLSLFLYIFDPLGMKFFTISINIEALAIYLLNLSHPYLLIIFGYNIIAAIVLSLFIDFTLFGLLSILSLVIIDNKYSIIINYILFYCVTIVLYVLSL